MRTSDNIADLAAALATAQGEFKNPPKDRTVKVKSKSTGVEYTFDYATFSAVLDVVRKPLSDNGLAFVQSTGGDEHGHTITTRLMHASGQWLEFDTPVFVADNGPQAFGSGVSYAKRYAVSSMLGIAPDDDDDANASEGNQVDMRSRGPARPPGKPMAPPPLPPPPQATRPNGNGTRATASINADTRQHAAETFVAQSIETFAKMPNPEEGIAAFWHNNSRHIEKLEANYPVLYDRLTTAADAAQLRRNPIGAV